MASSLFFTFDLNQKTKKQYTIFFYTNHWKTLNKQEDMSDF